jgi:hypothetical protein
MARPSERLDDQSTPRPASTGLMTHDAGRAERPGRPALGAEPVGRLVDADCPGTALLRCVPGFFGPKGAGLGLLAGPRVLQLVADAGHRVLLGDTGDATAMPPTVEETLPVIGSSSSSNSGRWHRARAAGPRVPDARFSVFLQELAAPTAPLFGGWWVRRRNEPGPSTSAARAIR